MKSFITLVSLLCAIVLVAARPQTSDVSVPDGPPPVDDVYKEFLTQYLSTWPEEVQNSSADFLESWQAYLDSLPADLAAEVTNKVEEKPAGDLIRGKRALRRTGNAAIGTRSSLVNARKFFEETSAKLHALETEFGRSL